MVIALDIIARSLGRVVYSRYHSLMTCLPKLSFTYPDVEDFLRESFKSKEDEDQKSLARKASQEDDSWFDLLLTRLGTVPPLFTTLRVNTSEISVEDAKKQMEEILRKQYEEKEGKDCPAVNTHHSLPDILVIPGTGPHNITPTRKEIIVDTFCGTAVLRGADVFAPGVIGAHPGIQIGDGVSVFADLDSTCRKGLAKPYKGSKMFVGNGLALMSRSDIFCGDVNVSGVAIEMTDSLYDCPSLSGILPGLVFPQNLPSVVAGHVLGPQPGETILDMCAAPGGKTTHLATLMDNKGIVVALDKNLPKVQKIRANCKTMGMKNVHAFHFNAIKSLDTKLPTIEINQEDVSHPPYPPESFDRILLDAPCSGLGQRPLSIVRMSLKELQSFPKLQKKIFPAAVGLLKEGGVLVYSTCTVTPQENEELVAWVLKTFPCMHLCPQNPFLGSPGLAHCGLTDEEKRLVQRFDPTATHSTPPRDPCDVDTIGFFIAKFFKETMK